MGITVCYHMHMLEKPWVDLDELMIQLIVDTDSVTDSDTNSLTESEGWGLIH